MSCACHDKNNRRSKRLSMENMEGKRPKGRPRKTKEYAAAKEDHATGGRTFGFGLQCYIRRIMCVVKGGNHISFPSLVCSVFQKS